jgi:LysM repeat protein
MAHRSPVRWLAPVALLGALLAVLLVLSSGGGGSDGGTAASSTGSSAITGSATTATTATTATVPVSGPRSYVVKAGDVLSGIAEATGVPLARIEELNSGIDAQTLHAGQKIKLAP